MTRTVQHGVVYCLIDPNKQVWVSLNGSDWLLSDGEPLEFSHHYEQICEAFEAAGPDTVSYADMCINFSQTLEYDRVAC